MARNKRRSKGKLINPVYYVFCEGQTEAEYVKSLNRRFKVNIDIKTNIQGNQISQRRIHAYLKNRTFDNKDRIFLFYDIDVPEIYEKLKSIQDAELLISNPCLELWFLLHFKDHRSHISTNQVEKELRNHFPSYSKGEISAKFNEKLIQTELLAISRAKVLSSPNNPSTTIYKLVESLISKSTN